MTEKFTASNGWYVQDGDLYAAQDWKIYSSASSESFKAAIEYGRHLERTERDRELGRERVEGYPDYAVYPHPYPDTVTVLDEVTGVGIRCHKSGRTAKTDSALVACAWFAAQEPPKPWLDAKPGEVWVLTVNGVEIAGVAIKHEDGAFISTHNCDYSVLDGRITAGRRIWPTGDAE